jgi:hypothetical protein
MRSSRPGEQGTGEKPADLPIQQSTKVALAKALGLTVPQTLAIPADKVIK